MDAVMNLSVFLAHRVGVAFLAIFALIAPAYGQKQYDPGASDTEILEGNVIGD